MPQSPHLINPFRNESEVERVQSDIPRSMYDFFFRKVLPGERSAQRAMINTFFIEFQSALKAEGIDSWQPGVDKKVVDVLKRLNFKQSKRKPKSAPNI